jgi:hypothetical protein
MKRVLLSVAVFACPLFFPLCVAAQDKASEDLPRLTNKEVVEMVAAGISSEIIIAKIKVSRCNFDTTPSVLAELKHKGIQNEVLLAMVEAPYGPPGKNSAQREP